jgi:mannose/fructose/N-acetylgalactosamine-specific phosphotransferase system component IIC
MNFKWTKTLAVAGCLIGFIAAINKGISEPAQILGYAIGLAVILLFFGFVFDLIGSKFGEGG